MGVLWGVAFGVVEFVSQWIEKLIQLGQPTPDIGCHRVAVRQGEC